MHWARLACVSILNGISSTGFRPVERIAEKEEGKDAERFDFSVSIHSVSGQKADEAYSYCAGTFGWRNGTAGHWVVSNKRAQSGENDCGLRSNKFDRGARGQECIVAGGLDVTSDYYIAIKSHSADGFEVGDIVDAH